MDDIKQVIVVRTDLNMPPGKLGVQVGHAVMMFLKERTYKWSHGVPGSSSTDKTAETFFLNQEIDWIEGIYKKVCLAVPNKEELYIIYDKARAEVLETFIVEDAGLTFFKFKEPTVTCLAIGPDFSSKIDKVTGHLPLL